MPTIHLITGFIGFGKTTLARKLAEELSAVRLTHDEFMLELFGTNPDDFEKKYQIVDDLIKSEAQKYIDQGKDVILDYGFWTHEKRKSYYDWAKTLTDSVVFHVLECDLDVAKQRVLHRTKTDEKALFVDENIFETLYQKFEPWSDQDLYPAIFHCTPTSAYIGKTVFVKIDRKKGSHHPKYGFEYPVNYGYVPFTKSGDGEELDAYVLEVSEPLEKYIGHCIGVVHRTNDNDDKLIIVPEKTDLSDEKIEEKIAFQEKWFEHILIRKEN